jgi:diguanylate cyclase (GGDEF)-like protein
VTSDSGPVPTPASVDPWVPRGLVVVLVTFAAGIWLRPEDGSWATAHEVAHDLVLYNAVYALAAAWSWRSAARSDGPRWGAPGRWLAIGLLLNAAGNVVYTLQDAAGTQPTTPSTADLLCLAFYPFLYVAVVKTVRGRAPRLTARMWLDGLIGASGAAAVAIAVLLAPALTGAVGRAGLAGLAEYATNLAFPAADVLLLALVVGIGGALGLRTDRTLLTVCAGLGLHLLGDVVYLDLQAVDRYVEGGVLDLTWLVGVAFVAGGMQPAPLRAASTRPTGGRELVEWRVLVVPVGCSVASVTLLAAGWGDRLPVSVACCAVACLVTVVARTVLTFRELRRLRDAGREARTDDLTGLPNRRALHESLELAFARATPQRPATVLLLDLDGFKQVNDRHGHAAGDELLREVGTRLSGVLRPAGTVFRLGGDEFAVLLPDTGQDAARGVAVGLLDQLARPFDVGPEPRPEPVAVGGSIGVATVPGESRTVDELLQRADDAMYVAKDTADGVRVHVDGAGREEWLREAADLRSALDRGDVTVHLRPQMSLTDGRTVRVEALARWAHPSRGVLGPADLRLIATRTDLRPVLVEALLDRACAAATRWWSHRAPLPVAVGLTVADVSDGSLPGAVVRALARHGLPPRALALEVSESCLGNQHAVSVLVELRALGVAVSVDDYGTGEGSLVLLRRLPADELTLGPALVADVATDVRAAVVVRHAVALGHDLGLRVVARGVEDGAVLGALAAMGCDAVEGAEVAAPMPVDAFVAWLRGRPADRAVPVTSVHLRGYDRTPADAAGRR